MESTLIEVVVSLIGVVLLGAIPWAFAVQSKLSAIEAEVRLALNRPSPPPEVKQALLRLEATQLEFDRRMRRVERHSNHISDDT